MTKTIAIGRIGRSDILEAIRESRSMNNLKIWYSTNLKET